MPPNLDAEPLIGVAVTVMPGVWTGNPQPSVRAELLVRGIPMEAPYLLNTADDGAEILVREYAVNSAGSIVISSAPVLARRRPPTVFGKPTDVATTQGAPEPTRSLASLFADAVGGVWTVTVDGLLDPARAVIDQEGVVTIRTATAWGGAVVARYANSGGDAACAFDVVVTPAIQITAPQQMEAPVVAALSDSALRVVCAAAPADGGAPITAYDLRWSVDETTWTLMSDVADPETISGLSPGATYHFQSRAVNAVGPGLWSPSSSAKTWAAPAAMAAPTLAGGVGQATVTLAAPPAANGSPITHYAWEIAAEPDHVFASPLAGGTVAAADHASPIAASALAAGSYIARSCAVNAFGAGPWSAPSLEAPVSVTPAMPAPTHDGSVLPNITTALGVVITPIHGASGFTGPALTFTATGTPAGVTIDAVTGAITGTPTALQAAAPLIVTATNAGGSISAPGFDMLVMAPNLTAGDPSVSGTALAATAPSAGRLRFVTGGTRATWEWRITDVKPGQIYDFSVLMRNRSSSGSAQLWRANLNPTLAGTTLKRADGATDASVAVASATGAVAFSVLVPEGASAFSVGFVTTVAAGAWWELDVPTLVRRL